MGMLTKIGFMVTVKRFYKNGWLAFGDEGAKHMLKSKSGRKKGPQKSVSVDMLAIRCLHDISVRFINKENINEIYECILDAAMVITGGDKAVLRLLNPQSQRLEILAQYGFSEEFAKTFYDVEIGKILSGSALKQGKRLIISDFRKSRFLNETDCCRFFGGNCILQFDGGCWRQRDCC